MAKAINLEALEKLNNKKLNSRLRILKEIAERTKFGSKYIPFNDLISETEPSRHVVHDAVHELVQAGMVIAIPGNPGELKVAPNIIIETA